MSVSRLYLSHRVHCMAKRIRTDARCAMHPTFTAAQREADKPIVKNKHPSRRHDLAGETTMSLAHWQNNHHPRLLMPLREWLGDLGDEYDDDWTVPGPIRSTNADGRSSNFHPPGEQGISCDSRSEHSLKWSVRDPVKRRMCTEKNGFSVFESSSFVGFCRMERTLVTNWTDRNFFTEIRSSVVLSHLWTLEKNRTQVASRLAWSRSWCRSQD